MDRLQQRNNTIHTVHKTKNSASSNAGQALSGRILVAEDNKALGDLVSRILDSVIFKPFFLDDLQSTVQRVLEPR
jgi:CheY-like chemotaxis protein